MNLQPNKGKKLSIDVGKHIYVRYPVKTHLISKKDDISDVVKKHVAKYLKESDIIVISERIVAISQGRSFLLDEIKPGLTANILSKFVYKHPGGIGLRSPWTMQLAIQEAGLWRILLAATLSIITKPFGLRGVFYRVAGNNINAIDGPCEYTLPPGNMSAKLGPKDPQKVAQEIEESINFGVAIIDANDYGVNILGLSQKARTAEFPIKTIFSDNPMGQADEQTPIVIVRLRK